MQEDEAQGLLRFVQTAGQLKATVRTGWVDRGVPAERVESVADHTFRVALLAWLASAGTGLDRNRVVILALLHDLAEATTGDLTPYDPKDFSATEASTRTAFLNQRHVPAEERAASKRAAESAAIAEMCRSLPVPQRDELLALWRELEDRATPEARFVKQTDKLETYLQSLEYAEGQPGLPVSSFAAEVADVIDIPELVAVRDAAGKSGESHPGASDDGTA
jgi:putative hydrolase of HD superfamily